MSISDAVAIGSVCVAGLSLAAAVYFGVKNSRLQQRLVELEQEREKARYVQSLQAVLRAEIQNARHVSSSLVISNNGKGTARNVKVLLDAVPLLEHGAIPQGVEKVDLIGPESEISCPVAFTQACHPPFALELTWDDDSGQQGKYSTTLTG